MVVKQRLTLEEFLALPEEKPALEYGDGEVTQKVSPKFRHGRLQFVLASRIDRPGQLIALTETRVTFAGRSRVPDVIAIVNERLPRDENGEPLDDLFLPPDVAIEIRSPGQSRRGQIERCRWYVANGVRVAPLVDPIDRAVTVFRPDGQHGPLAGDDLVDLSDVVPGCTFTVNELFAALRAG